jgi:hypothetical protein
VSIPPIAPVLIVFLAGSALAQAPVPGRYRCYEPPAYAVMAWFDLTPGEIAINGDAPLPIRIDTVTGGFDLPPGAIPPWRRGVGFAMRSVSPACSPDVRNIAPATPPGLACHAAT